MYLTEYTGMIFPPYQNAFQLDTISERKISTMALIDIEFLNSILSQGLIKSGFFSHFSFFMYIMLFKNILMLSCFADFFVCIFKTRVESGFL
jgi:hypothetical protein